ncbi:MAG TPA: Holliday junction resolvase RuvX [Candidatus Paceibacterota bacterium]|jgi:putative transcription antitermination factor YqgF|nr:Holliday junction resolvase RuvX [Candidatus Paceibacterota bacterium]
MRYIGIDYGTKKVGIAFSDEAGTMGFPHSVVPNDGRLFDALRALIASEKPQAIVVGDSKDYKGEDNAIMEEARGVAARLGEATGLPVHFEPEMLTTQEARRDFEGVRTDGHSVVDSSAAALILTSFLSRQAAPAAPAGKARISIDAFSKIEVKIGTVRTAERVPETDKLLRLTVDFGEESGPRQIVSGINAYVNEPEDLVGRQLAFVTNLEPRTIKGLESNGMLFAVGEGDTFAFITPDRPVPPGTGAH